MSVSSVGPDYLKRLHVADAGSLLTLRTTLSLPHILWAGLISTFASLPITILLEINNLYPPQQNITYGLAVAGVIFGTATAGTLLSIFLALQFRRRIVLDKERNLLLIRSRTICPLSEVDHVEKVQGLLLWCSLAFVLKSGRKIYFLNHPALHSSADTLAEKLANFLRVPYKDYGNGDYYAILRLVALGDRLMMNPPNRSLARWITNIAWVVLMAGALYFIWVLYPRQTGHEMESGGRGLGLIIFGIASCVNYLANRIFHRRIVLDLKQNRLSIGFRRVCALNEIAHIGLHLGQTGNYKLAFVLTGGRQVPIITYDSRLSTTTGVADALAHFLHIPVVDYHDRAVTQRIEHKRQARR